MRKILDNERIECCKELKIELKDLKVLALYNKLTVPILKKNRAVKQTPAARAFAQQSPADYSL